MANKEIEHNVTEQFFNFGIHIPTRTIYVGSEEYVDSDESGTDFKMAEKALKGLHCLNAIKIDDITLVMNNLGGSEYHGMAIYDAIKLSPSRVDVVGTGHVMSMGSIILQAASKRYLTENAMMMLHYGSWEGNGDSRDFEAYAKENNRFRAVMENIYLKCIQKKHKNYSLSNLRELLKTETFVTAKEAVGLGLADKIIKGRRR